MTPDTVHSCSSEAAGPTRLFCGARGLLFALFVVCRGELPLSSQSEPQLANNWPIVPHYGTDVDRRPLTSRVDRYTQGLGFHYRGGGSSFQRSRDFRDAELFLRKAL